MHRLAEKIKNELLKERKKNREREIESGIRYRLWKRCIYIHVYLGGDDASDETIQSQLKPDLLTDANWHNIHIF